MIDVGENERISPPTPDIDILLKDPSHPAYISPDATILDIGTGRDEVLPMSPAFYMLAEYMQQGTIVLSDVPTTTMNPRSPEEQQLLGKFGLAASLQTIQRFHPDFLNHIESVEFDMFDSLPTDLPQFDVVFDHLTTWDWFLRYASLGEMTQQEIADHVVQTMGELLHPAGKLLFCTTMKTEEDKQKHSVVVTALQNAGFHVLEYGPLTDRYTVSPSITQFVYDVRSRVRNMQGHIRAHDNRYTPAHQATHLLVATK